MNRVTSSGLITFNLEEYYPKGERVLLDIKDLLFEGLVLKEKDLREFIKRNNWEQYQNKHVAITCSADAIIPNWAFMLIATALQPYAAMIQCGDLNQLEEKIFQIELSKINWDEFRGKKIVVKGCSNINVPVSIYVEVVRYLQPVASSIMFGEPCSTVPLFKAPKSVAG